MLPARGDVPPPPGFPDLARVPMMKSDIAAILRDDERNKERFADLFGR
jgi:hypothetical protein